MDFTLFEDQENIMGIAWLGRLDWISFKDNPANRSIEALPKEINFQNRGKELPKSGIVVDQREQARFPQNMWTNLKDILDVLQQDTIGTFWHYTLSKALAGGPKIFRPTNMQCQAMQHSEANFSFNDYKQPYPVIIIEIPEEYRSYLSEQYHIKDTPKFVFVNHDEKNKFIAVSSFYNKQNIIVHVTPDREEYKTIESSLILNRQRRLIEDKSSEREFDAAENVQRLAINFAMIMSLYTLKEAKPLDLTNYKLWQEQAKQKKNGNPTKPALDAQIRLASTLRLIEFDQQVDLYDEIDEDSNNAENTEVDLHKSPRTHWRRGHFAMQPCGEGRRERKLIFRKATLVRAKHFIGELQNASVTYTLKSKV